MVFRQKPEYISKVALVTFDLFRFSSFDFNYFSGVYLIEDLDIFQLFLKCYFWSEMIHLSPLTL